MPMMLIDYLLRGSDCVDEEVQDFFDRNTIYLTSGLKNLFKFLKGTASVVTEIRNWICSHEDISEIKSMFSNMYKFRVPHLKTAQENFKLREKSALWSWWYSPEILEKLLQITNHFRESL